MADDAQEKTEDPTAKRQEEAKKKGQIARSKELGTTLVLVSSAIAFLILGRDIGQALLNIMRRSFTLSRDETYDYTHMFQAWASVIEEISTPIAFYMLIVAIGGIYGSIALGGYNFSWEAAGPKASKMNPISGLKRMFGPNGLVELFKAVAKFAVVGTSTYVALNYFREEALHLDQEVYPANLFHALELIGWIFLIICCATIPIAIFDVPYQSYKHTEEMKMSKQAVKDEQKNADGNPEVKSRIRKLQYQSAANRMMKAVPEADVVVTNPTHFAVALKYDQDGEMAPMVVAKGGDELAMHLRKIATAHDVPLVESPMLARAIFFTTEVDHPIPDKLFMAVAQVLAYVYQLKKFNSGKGQKPTPLSKDLPIPAELHY